VSQAGLRLIDKKASMSLLADLRGQGAKV